MHKINYRIQRRNGLNDVYYDSYSEQNGVPYAYSVIRKEEATDVVTYCAEIQFQKGARNLPDSTPGVIEGDLLEIVRHRLQAHQRSEYATRENACALTHIEEALLWIAKRADDRAERGVLGTNNK
jgi:ERCC4-related helicase